MSTKLYTDEELDKLRSISKRVTNPGARWLKKPKDRPAHDQRSYKVSGQQDSKAHFEIYQRQSIEDEYDFSCGIRYLPPGGSSLALARYNGPGHEHGEIAYRPHIHRASEKAIAADKKPESEAEKTDRFSTLEGALACLIDDFRVSGIRARHDEPKLAL